MEQPPKNPNYPSAPFMQAPPAGKHHFGV